MRERGRWRAGGAAATATATGMRMARRRVWRRLRTRHGRVRRLWRRRRGHGLKGRSGEGGDDGDGDGGGEAATGRMITDEAASGLEAACAACDHGQRRRGRGVVTCGAKIATGDIYRGGGTHKPLQAVEYILLVPPNECVPQDFIKVQRHAFRFQPNNRAPGPTMAGRAVV